MSLIYSKIFGLFEKHANNSGYIPSNDGIIVNTVFGGKLLLRSSGMLHSVDC